ncbi:hypothetical protein [Staphylococcus shinii]|uniref:hypothetical protein n=1 Tax=Staphylococcus shinii TaxID=2912228 RepID=UPI003F573FC7
MYTVKYSIFSYYPDIYLKSNMAVGVAFQINAEDYYENMMYLINKKRKLMNFDDEIEDLEIINFFLEGVENEFLTFNGPIENYTKRFVNNFKFEQLETKICATISEAKEFIDKTYRYILHLGLDKKDRLKDNDRKHYVQSYLESKYEKIYSRKVVHGLNKLDKMTPDFVAIKNNEEYLYKFINNSNTSVHNARSYILYASQNNVNLTLILEDDMVEVKEFLNQLSKDFNSKTLLTYENELVFS